MSLFTYLGSYAVSTADNITFSVTFTIPDNCGFQTSGANGTYCIAIALNSGASLPSTNFVPQTASLLSNRGFFEADFLMPDQKGVKKPKISAVSNVGTEEEEE
ncbi:hypothetical protein [Flavobacterium sp.]|uniref:hypothetical protein n=1 Tax=Flavobacterium sp. TaxID=239 RepID=UPI00120DB699|nr:hypothetical protein [Flavobacterium sp.]RZJ72224.1 MAG: hypothetical protein EOO49_07165 [Flavobacterium sp.]